MLPLAAEINTASGLPMVIGAGAAMYIASKALVDALTNGNTQRSNRLAMGQWLPIAVLAMVAAGMGQAAVAVGLIFSTAIACLSLAAGSVAVLGAFTVPVAARRTWVMLIPTGLIAFLAGFQSSVSIFNAAVLAMQGVCVLLLWNERTPHEPGMRSPDRPPRRVAYRVVESLLGLSLTGVGSWLALHGVDRIAADSEIASQGLLSATLLSPLLVLPIIGTGTEMAHRRQSAAAVSANVAVALLNACALLPLVVVVYFGRQYFVQNLLPHLQTISPFSAWLPQDPLAMHSTAVIVYHALPFPLAVWRVDIVLYIALGLMLVPVALGRWSMSRLQGAGLLAGYLFYIALSILIAIRRF